MKNNIVVKTDAFELRLFFGLPAIIMELLFIVAVLAIQIAVQSELVHSLLLPILAINFIFIVYLLFKGFTVEHETESQVKQTTTTHTETTPTPTHQAVPTHQAPTESKVKDVPVMSEKCECTDIDDMDWEEFLTQEEK